jgi:ferredoxin
MPHVITEACIGVKDGACVAMCPMNGIHPTPEEAAFKSEEMLYIDPNHCIDCGLCADECAVQAIYPSDQVPAQWRSYIERNAGYYQSR